MMKVASSEGVSIYCREGDRFSFFNSPYPAHRACMAIDIYPGRDFGSAAPSPVSGEVKEIRRVACPEKSIFKSSSYDYVILLQSLENPKRWIKILHLEPLIKVGNIVNVGDDLGILLRSGFFDYWTDPHIHIEIRDPLDPIRARGGFVIKRDIFNTPLNENEENADIEELRGVIVESKIEYALMLLDKELKYGVPVKVDEETGLIDGGIPHYGFFGVHRTSSGAPRSNLIKLCNVNIGVIKHTYSNMCVAEYLNQLFRVKNVPVKLSFYLYLSKPLVKIIPSEAGKLKLEKSEEVSVVISSQ
ncbi:MAG: hypothetical protein QW186_04310 [Candidatus Bathyarchaeia archaeon]